jgi:hypothetical protein
MSLPWRCDVTADEWAAEEYRQQRRKKGCGRSPIAVLVLTLAMVIRKGLKRR